MNHFQPEIINLTELRGTACPCGTARRAFQDQSNFPATVHLTDIQSDAKSHYHNKLTEVYVILSCDSDAEIELDGTCYPVKPLTAVFIPPGVKHRAVGKMQVLIICNPKFDPTDENF
jgi:mannose-6-phosphate isomerase-like protein (cupin superfamily)